MEQIKKIILSNETVEMTFDEVFNQFERLLHKKIKPWSVTFEYEELFQTVSIALWKAYMDYEATLNNRFISVASSYIDNALLAFYSKNKSKYDRQTSQIKSVVSLYHKATNNQGDTIPLIDQIREDETFTQDVIDQIVIENMMERIPENQTVLLQAHLEGYTQRELARKYNMSRSTVWYRIDAALNQFKKMYDLETAY